MDTPSQIDALYRRYYGMTKARAVQLLRDSGQAEDLAQEVFIKFLEHRRRQGSEHNTAAFLYRMTTNLALNRIRNNKRRRTLLERIVPTPSSVAQSDAQLQLTELLAKFSETDAQIAYYYYVDGMPQDEIAELMELSRRTIGNRLARFRKRAQRLLGAVTTPRLREEPEHG